MRLNKVRKILKKRLRDARNVKCPVGHPHVQRDEELTVLSNSNCFISRKKKFAKAMTERTYVVGQWSVLLFQPKPSVPR